MQRFRLRARLRRRRQRIALALGFLLGAAYVVVVHTTIVRDALEEAMVGAVREELGLEVGISRVSLGLEVMPPALTVSAHGVEIRHPEHGRLAKAERLLVQPAWLGFLKGSFELGRIQLDRPEVTLVVRDGEILNGPELPDSDDDEEPSIDLPFSRFLVIDGAISVDVDGQVSSLRDLRVDLEHEEGALAVFLSTGRVVIAHPEGEDAIESISLAARLPSLDEAFVDHLAVSLAEGSVKLVGGSLPLPFRNEGHVERAQVDLDLSVLERVPESVGVPPITGHLALDGALGLDADGPRFEGEVVVDELFIDDVGVGGRIDLKLDVNAERARLLRGTKYHVLHDGGRAAVEGTIGLGGSFPVALDVEIETLKLERLLWQLGVTPDAIIDWELGGTSRLEGQLIPFTLAGPLRARAGRFVLTSGAHHERPRDVVLEARGGRVDGRLVIRESGLHFDRMRLDTGRSTASVDFLIGFEDEFWLKVRDGDIDLSEISPLVGVPIAGRAAVEVDIGDTYSDVALHGSYSIVGFEFGEMPLGRIHSGKADLEKDGLAVRFHQIRATKGSTNYRIADLLLDFEEAFELTATGTLDRFTLADVREILGLEEEPGIEDVEATGTGSVSARYTMGFPNDPPSGTLRLAIDSRLESAEVLGVPFDGGEATLSLDWADLDGGIEGMALDLERVHLTKEGGTAALGGRLLRGGVLAMDIAIDRMALEGLPEVRALSDALTGTVGGIGRIGGTLDVPFLDLELRLSNLAYENTLLGDGRFDVRLVDRPTIEELDTPPGCERAWAGLSEARWRRPPDPQEPGARTKGPPMAWLICGAAFDGALSADFAVGWARDVPLRGELVAEGLDLTPFLPHGDGAPLGRASMSGRAVFTGGGLEGREGLSGTVQLDRVRAAFGDVRFGNVGPVRIDLDRGRARVRRARFGGAGTRLELRGTGTERKLAFRIDGDVDVSALGAVTPLVKGSDGRMSLGMSIGGSAANPSVTGTLALEDISFFARDLPVPVRDLAGTVRFDERRILLEEVTARVGGGKARLGGKVEIRGNAIQRYRLDGRFTGVSYSPEEATALTLGGDVRLVWQSGDERPTLAGAVSLERAQYTRAVNLSPTIGELNRPKRESIRDPYAAEEHLNLDLVLRQKRPIQIRNNVADVDIVVDEQTGPFRIVGTDARPGAHGSLRISRGTMRFRSTDFVVRDGTIVFASGSDLDPRFDITATTQIIRADVAGPMWRIFLRAHGTMDAFQLDATSEPSLTQQDIALLLTIGMTGAEAQSVQAGAFSGAALEALSAVTGVDDELTSALGVIDDISLTTAYHPVTNRPEPQVTVSKRLSDQVRLRASTGLASETRDVSAALQWRLGQQTSAELKYDNIDRESASSFGNVGVDIRWRIEFE